MRASSKCAKCNGSGLSVSNLILSIKAQISKLKIVWSMTHLYLSKEMSLRVFERSNTTECNSELGQGRWIHRRKSMC